MKKKGLLTLAIAPALMLGIVACDTTTSSTSPNSTTPAVSTPAASSNPVDSSTAPVISTTVPNSTPPAPVSPTVPVSTPVVNPDPFADPVDSTVAAINAKTESELRNLYRVTGVVENITNTQYGTFKLSDKVTGESVSVYSLAASAAFLEGAEEGKQPARPENFASLELEEGDVITMVGYINIPYITSPVNFIGYYESHIERSEVKYDIAISVADGVGGTAVASATNASYGEEVTINITPDTGYYASGVSLNGAGIAFSGNTVKISVGLFNTIVVTFTEGEAPVFSTTKYTFNDDKVGVNAGTLISTEITDGVVAAGIFSACAGEGVNVVASVSSMSKFYYVENNGIKLGTGSAVGTFTLSLTEKVTSVTVRATAWNKKLGFISVNGTVKQIKDAGDSTNTVYEDLTFTFETPTTELVISSTDDGQRVILAALTLTK